MRCEGSEFQHPELSYKTQGHKTLLGSSAAVLYIFIHISTFFKNHDDSSFLFTHKLFLMFGFCMNWQSSKMCTQQIVPYACMKTNVLLQN